MFMDYVMNGQGFGEVAEQMVNCRFDPGLMRPFFNSRGQRCVTVNTGAKRYDERLKMEVPVYKNVLIADLMKRGIYNPTLNATSLRKDEWIQLDTVVLQAARQRLRAWADLAAANSYGGFNGMGKMLLEHETMSDPGSAVVDMDGLSEAYNDQTLFQLEGLPLPITHSGFFFSKRYLMASRNGSTPISTTMAEAAGRRVAEMVEKTLIGVETGVTYGRAADYNRAPTVFGYTNFPDRITKTDITAPSGGAWTPDTLIGEVLEMRQLLYDAKFYGPFMLYHSDDWDTYLDNDYYAKATSGMVAPSKTIRSRLREIEGIQDVRRLDFFTDTFSLLMVQMTSDVARAVNGMDITTIQWESQGGMRLNFKVMAIMVPQLRADYNGNCGICHATTA